MPYRDLIGAATAESSALIRQRVERARVRQRERFRERPGLRANAHMTARDLRRYCALGAGRKRCSARRSPGSASRPGRTTGSSRSRARSPISPAPMSLATSHVSEAIQYRSLDRTKGPRDAGHRRGGSRATSHDAPPGQLPGAPVHTDLASVLVPGRPPVALGGRAPPLALQPRRLGRPRRRVRFRGLGTTSARATTSRSRSVTSSRFRSWLREPLETSRRRPAPSSRLASRASRRWRCSSLSGGRARDVPPDLDPRRRRVDVLPARPAGARGAKLELRERHAQLRRDLERVPSGMPETNCVRALTCVPYRITLLPMTDLDLLRRHLLGFGRVVLGYSGGVDSALLAVVGRQALGPERLLAVIGRSAVVSRGAVAEPRSSSLGGSTCRCSRWTPRELADPRYLGNPTEPLLLLQDRAVDPPGRGGAASAASTPSSTAPMPTTWASTARGCARPRSIASARRSPSSAGPRRPCVRRRATLGLADLGCAGGAVPLEPGGLRPRDHAAPPPPGRGGRGVPARAWRHRRPARPAPRRPCAHRGGARASSQRVQSAWDAVDAFFGGLGFADGRARSRRLPAGRTARPRAALASLMRLFAGHADRRRGAARDRRAARAAFATATGPCAGCMTRGCTSRSSSTARWRPSGSR